MTKDKESKTTSQTPPTQDSAENYDIVTCPSFDYSISSLAYSIASTDFMGGSFTEEDDSASKLDTIDNEHKHSPSRTRSTRGKKSRQKSSENCHSPKSVSKMVIQEDQELLGLRWTE
jgi:hypothetical protein